MDNFFKLKDTIQDLIDGGTVLIDGPVKNSNHKAFKTPLPEYDKGESLQASKKNYDAKIHYTYVTNDNVINMIKPIEDVFMMRLQKDDDANYDIPKLVLWMLNNSSSQSETLNTVTGGQAKIFLCTVQDPKQTTLPK